MGIWSFNNPKDRKTTEEWASRLLTEQQKMEEQHKRQMQQMEIARMRMEIQQKAEEQQKQFLQMRQAEEQQKEKQRILEEKRKREFQDLVRMQEQDEKSLGNEVPQNQNRVKRIEKNSDNRKQLQQELTECSKAIRDMQRIIKDAYQFEPCRQLCELLVNVRQNVYQSVDEIQEDLGYVVEAFGINEFEPVVGEAFDAKYHDQVYSDRQDARGREIAQVYASGFEVDGEVIVKAQVRVKYE